MFKNKLLFAGVLITTLTLSCTKDMAIQNRLTTENHVFILPPEETQPFQTGSVTEASSETLIASQTLLKQGRERFLISCAPCHDAEGTGNGIIVQHGFPHPPRLDSGDVTAIDDDTIVLIIHYGFGLMHGFGERITSDDKRAIVSYVRFLQLRHAHPELLLPRGSSK